MPSSSDFTGETNFMAQYMSNMARAGVYLTSAFPNVEPDQDYPMLPSLQGLPGFHIPPHFATRGSLQRGDSLEEDDSSYSGDQDSNLMSDQMAAAHVTGEDSIVDWEESQTGAKVMGSDCRQDPNDPLLKKLEQLRELQQQKQDQLKRQQMEQLQKLMEEQKMLLSMVSRQGPFMELEPQDPSSGNNDGFAPLRENYVFATQGFQNNPADSIYSQGGFYRCLSPDEQDVYEKPEELNVRSRSSSSCASVLAEVQRIHHGQYGDDDDESDKDEMESNDETVHDEGENSSSCYDNSGAALQDQQEDFLQKPTGTHKGSSNTEERPIVSEIKERKKSFEEFVEEQMRLEEQRLRQNDQQKAAGVQTTNKTMVKRPFLRRGEGLVRFSNSNKSKSQVSKSGAQIKVSDAADSTQADKRPLQRKTAPVAREQMAETGPYLDRKSCSAATGKSEPTMKKSVLKTHNLKNSLSLATHRQPENISTEDVKSIKTGLEKKYILDNKENIENVMPPEASRKGAGKQKPKMSSPQYNVSKRNEELSFEVSFQKRQVNWEKERQKENFELDEFVLLEQAAEEISFSSNSSFVQKLLNENYQSDTSSRRLSSTPVKSPHGQPADVDRTTEHNTVQRRKEAAAVLKNISCVAPLESEGQYRKDAGKMFPPAANEVKPVTVSEDDCVSSEDESDTLIKHGDNKGLEVTTIGREDILLSDDCKDMSKATKARDFDLDLSDGLDESTLLEGNSNDPLEDDHSPSLNTSHIDFDDERTWADLEDAENQPYAPQGNGNKEFIPSDYTSKSPVPALDKTVKRKVASKKGDALKSVAPSDHLGTPPTSDLVMKLFPALKPKPQNEAQLPKSAPEQEEAGDSVRSRLLREKLVELETEIERFKIENAAVAKRREDQEKAMESLRKDMAAFEQQKALELAKFEEFKKEEIKKLQKERKVFEKYASAARAVPDKREREEIQGLKQQVADLQEDIKRKEAKWSTTQGRLRNQIDALSKENTELKEEIKFIEKVRLDNWKKAEAAENKNKESMKAAESHGVQARRLDCGSPQNTRKIQVPSLFSQAEKNPKVVRRSQSPPKGKAVKNCKPSPTSNAGKADTGKAESAGIVLLGSDRVPQQEPKHPIPVNGGNEEDVQGEVTYSDGKVERILRNGYHVIEFPNGTRKEVSADGKSTTVKFFNGDVKQVLGDQRIIYYYADDQTTHTTYPDGLEILQFSNGQIGWFFYLLIN
ncbi:hypothetical protein XENTR_v10007020 [Xenopus tropicalis]|nr:hypothetical protein XENTR_v10007020 [Xenopus tropicalis]